LEKAGGKLAWLSDGPTKAVMASPAMYGL